MKWVSNLPPENFHLGDRKGWVLGMPQATETYTVDEMLAEGLKGLYKIEEGEGKEKGEDGS